LQKEEQMTNPLDARTFQERLQRLDVLLQELERFPDPAVQTHGREMMQAVLELHGTALERLLQHADPAFAATCARDEVVSGLLLLHGLHPLDLETRIRQALDDARPLLRGHGGDVALVEVTDGVVRLRLEGNCHGCPSSAVTMKQTIEEAIFGRAPDATAVEVAGLEDMAAAPAGGGARFALPVLG